MQTKKFFKEEYEKLKDMTFRKKWEYIMEYYKYWIIGIAGSLIFIISILVSIISNSYDSVLHTVLINSQILSEEDTDIVESFLEYSGLDAEPKQITMDISININRDSSDMYSLNAHQKLVTLFAADSLDVFLSDEENFLFFAESGGFSDLKEVLPDDLYAELKDSFYMVPSGEDGQPYAYGVKVKDSKVLDRNHAYSYDPVFAIPYKSPNKENAVLFLRYLLEK